MYKNKNKKTKLNVVDLAFICGTFNLSSEQLQKYEKKMYKNAPEFRNTLDLIGKDDKATLALMIGYHIAKTEKHNKKRKKAIVDAHMNYKTVVNDTYGAINAVRDSVGNTNIDKVVPQTDDESSSSQYTVPKYIDGEHFKILVTNVDIDNGTLTYLDLGKYGDVTPACAASVLIDTRSIDEAAHCELAEKFGIGPEYVNSGVDYIRTELPTKEQIETLKTFDISRFDTVLSSHLTDKPILVDDGTDEGMYESRTALMPNGKLEKRRSNWRALLIPSVTIDF